MKNVRDLFKSERELWLEKARDAAVQLLNERPIITIEDVLKVCSRPDYVHPNTTGRVFNDKKIFRAVGWRPSARTEMNGRQVRTWMLRHS